MSSRIVPSIVETDRYSAPALEKGLNILELLSDQPTGLTQKAIADELQRTPSEIFRMLTCLEKRGYVRRQKPSDNYVLTARLFAMAHRHPPTKVLLDRAIPILRRLAGEVFQSCHLAVRFEHDMLVQAQVDSPDPRGFSVRIGARFPLLETGSGHVLLAFMHPEQQQDLLEELIDAPRQRQRVAEELRAVRTAGFGKSPSHTIEAVIDLSAPVLDHTGTAVAAVTVPFLMMRKQAVKPDQALEQLVAATRELTEAIGGVALET